jgi:hypothetical protein
MQAPESLAFSFDGKNVVDSGLFVALEV